MHSNSRQLGTEWFDTDIYGGCLALSLVLPDFVPLQSVFPIRILRDFFENRGDGIAGIDDRWMTCPYVLMTKWVRVPWPIHPWIEDFSIAEDALAKAGIGTAPTTAGSAVDLATGHPRSVALIVLPVKALGPALESRQGKVNAITFAHWVIAEWLRAVRVGTRLPIQELTRRRMPVVVPARYAQVVDGQLHWHDDKHDLVSDDFLDRTLTPTVAPNDVVDRVGQAFSQLTWGRPGAVVLDHIMRGDTAAMGGDDVGSLLAYATACEVAIVNLTLALRWEGHEKASDVAQELRGAAASTLVPSLCHALGDNWSLDLRGPARSWFVDVALVRNRVIHAGSTPTADELRRARNAVHNLMNFIAKRLVVKWKMRPKTLALLVSRESVDLYASKKSHARVVETIETLAEQCEEEYAAWRRDYQASR